MRRRWGIGAAATGAAALALWLYLGSWRPDPADYPIQGVDIAAGDGAVDWKHLRAAGADFAYIEATRGSASRDPAFQSHWAATRAAGIRHGAIHVWSMCAGGAAQATNFIATVPREADALPAALAFVAEEPGCPAPADPAALARELRQFLAAAEAHLAKPMLLRVPGAVERRLGITTAIDRPLWATRFWLVPAYGTRPWVLWQASDRRRVEGAARPINWNVVRP